MENSQIFSNLEEILFRAVQIWVKMFDIMKCYTDYSTPTKRAGQREFFSVSLYILVYLDQGTSD